MKELIWEIGGIVVAVVVIGGIILFVNGNLAVVAAQELGKILGLGG